LLKAAVESAVYVVKKGKKYTLRGVEGWQLHLYGDTPTAERTITIFGMRGRVADVIISFKFYRNRLRGFRAPRGQKWGLPLILTVALTTVQHYCAACDKNYILILRIYWFELLDSY